MNKPEIKHCGLLGNPIKYYFDRFMYFITKNKKYLHDYDFHILNSHSIKREKIK